MKTFKQLISEMPVDNDYTEGKRLQATNYRSYLKNTQQDEKTKTVSKWSYNDDYDIHHHSVSHGEKYGTKHYFDVIHKPTGNIHLRLVTHTMDGNLHRVSDLHGAKENTLKTQHLYKHLLQNKKIDTLFSDHTHSPGAKKVWKRLHDMPDIDMKLVDRGKHLPINKNNWNNNYGKFSALFMARVK